MILGLAALVTLAGSPPGVDARTAKTGPVECTEYCGDKAAEKCDDVTSTWCNAYILGCLAGCGIAHL
jgi:hypothetical protein